MKLVVLLFLGMVLLSGVLGDCGCIQCSKHLRLVSPPHAPIKVLYRGHGCNCAKPFPYQVEIPIIPSDKPCQTRSYGYQVKRVLLSRPQELCRGHTAHHYDVEKPEVPYSKCQKLICGLTAHADRVVLPHPPSRCIYQRPCGPPPKIEKYHCDDEEYYRYAFPKISTQVLQRSKRSTNPFDVYKLGLEIKKLQQEVRQHKLRNEMLQRHLKDARASKLQPNKFFLEKGEDSYSPYFQEGHQIPSQAQISFVKYPCQNPRNIFKKPDTNTKPYPIPSLRRRVGTTTQRYDEDFINSRIEEVYGGRDYTQNENRKLSENFFTGRNPFFQKRIGELRRSKRSVELEPSEELGEFYIIKSVEDLDLSEFPEEVVEELGEDSEEIEDFENEIVGSVNSPLFPYFDFKHIVPYKPIFYFLTTPVRILHQFAQLKNRISPIVKTLPVTLKNSQRYILNFGKDLRSNALNFASNIIGDFDDRGSTSLIKYPRHKIFKRNANKRTKRTLLKVVDEGEIEDFLKEKLSLIGETDTKVKVKNENKELTGSSRKSPAKSKQISIKSPSSKKKIILEKVKPKIVIDNNGLPFLEINGLKKPVLNRNWFGDSLLQKTKSSGPIPYHVDEHNVNEAIEEILEKAKNLNENDMVGKSEPLDAQMYEKLLKEEINQTLTKIHFLMTDDLESDFSLFENVLKLQNQKGDLTDNWKIILMGNKANSLKDKLRILAAIQDIQDLKDTIVKTTINQLNEQDYHNKKRLIKLMVKLQKLQVILVKIVEDFGQKIGMGRIFDIPKEIAIIDNFEGIRFLTAKNREDIQKSLKEERDSQLDSSMKLLDKLKKVSEDVESESKDISALGKLLWEINNIKKLQKITFEDLKENMDKDLSIRRDLKILFDLQSQFDNLEVKMEELLEGSPKTVDEGDQKPIPKDIVGNKWNQKPIVKQKPTPLKDLLEKMRSRLKKPNPK